MIQLTGPFATLTDSTGTHIVGGRVEMSPLIRDSVWETIRDQFSEAEKVNLRQAITGQAICPKGVVIDVDLLDMALRDKLTAAVAKAARTGRA